jgi:dihydrofolate reductase
MKNKSEKKVLISIIASVGRNRELGKNNDLIWKIPEDLKYFKKVTLGHPVIMGEKTYCSIGKPLSKRTNIVLTDNEDFACNGCEIARSINEALTIARKKENKEIFFIGGAGVFNQIMDITDRLYLTVIDDSAEADVFFPDYSKFKRSKKLGSGNDSGIGYKFMIFEK